MSQSCEYDRCKHDLVKIVHTVTSRKIYVHTAYKSKLNQSSKIWS